MYRKIIGIILFLIGAILIFNSFSGMTGFVVSNLVGKGISSILGFGFIIGGGILLILESRLERNLEDFKNKTAIITDPKKLMKIANRLGYDRRNVKEGCQILNEKGKPITVIPKHSFSKRVYFNIRDALLTGQSNFRKAYG